MSITDSLSPQLYIFGWPSNLGGADTKLVHLLILLHKCLRITIIPNRDEQMQQKQWTRFLDQHKIQYLPFQNLPSKLEGAALALSNQSFFTRRIAHRAKEKGLRIIWSSEMMWHHRGELAAIKEGIIDAVLYTSEIQKEKLSPGYEGLPSAITGNYIDPASFPYKRRNHPEFRIGRLSRADPAKHPEDFPVFYESLELPNTRFRVMAWNKKLAHKYQWHSFSKEWDLLLAEEEGAVDFLHSLDLFIYPLGHTFTESWGRSTVEAMLTGCIPLVPPGHHLENLVVPGVCGFVCHDFQEYQENAHWLNRDSESREKMALACREHAVNKLCNTEHHRAIWLSALTELA